MHALADDDTPDFIDCGPGNDTAWVNAEERGKTRTRRCETVNIVVPTPEQEAEEAAEE
jgi:hypothetical protein